MFTNPLSASIGRQVSLPGHFDVPVTLEAARPLGTNGSAGFKCRVRLPDGRLEETILSAADAALLGGSEPTGGNKVATVDAACLQLLVESARIRLASSFDCQFALSLSGIRTLPHQIEAG